MGKSICCKKTLIRITLPLIILVVWEVLAYAINNEFILPKLESIALVLLTPTADILGTGGLLENALTSITRVFIGFFIAAVLAIPLGIMMGRREVVYDFFDVMVQVIRPVPPLAWVPLSLAWFKIGITSMAFLIALGAFFPILLNTLDGVKGVKRTWIEAAANLGASEWQILTKVILQGSAPTIWTGLRVGFGIAWMCVVAAEMLPGTNSGLGYLIMYAYNWGQIQVIIAGMVVIGLIGLLIDSFFKEVERRKFNWRELDR